MRNSRFKCWPICLSHRAPLSSRCCSQDWGDRELWAKTEARSRLELEGHGRTMPGAARAASSQDARGHFLMELGSGDSPLTVWRSGWDLGLPDTPGLLDLKLWAPQRWHQSCRESYLADT